MEARPRARARRGRPFRVICVEPDNGASSALPARSARSPQQRQDRAFSPSSRFLAAFIQLRTRVPAQLRVQFLGAKIWTCPFNPSDPSSFKDLLTYELDAKMAFLANVARCFFSNRVILILAFGNCGKLDASRAAWSIDS